MKILIVGLGSIGARHLRNILHLGYTDVSIVSRSGILPIEFSSLSVYSTLTEALSSSHFDAAVICTPTALHSADVKKVLAAKIPSVYIEKPVSHSLEEVNDLLTLSQSYACTVVVGYDLHFDKGLQKVKQLLEEDAIGKVVSVNAQVGQYLPGWRPQQDYRIGMSAKKETGGGVMLDLVHEFDYLQWLLGTPLLVACQYANTGTLEIETEDVCEVLVRFKNGAVGTIHLDYLQRELVRNCMITGSTGTIWWNLADRKVEWINENKVKQIFSYDNFERNDRFIEIMQSFLEQKEDTRLTNLESGIESLRWVMAAKYSAENRVFVNIKTFDSLAY